MTSEPLDEGLFWLVYVCVLGAAILVMGVILGLMERWRAYLHGAVLPLLPSPWP